MKKLSYILSISAITALLFTGCYTQLTTRDRDYSGSGSQNTYSGNQGYAEQGRDYAYDDSSEYYSDNYYDSTGNYYDGEYGDNSDYNYSNYNSPYYYDDFYYSYPSYRRYFWSYHPSIVIGFNWGSWYSYPYYYDPFYWNVWYSWYYPGTWGCLPFYYYYPSPYYYGYNYYYYGWGYPTHYHNYYTYRERTRDMVRLRNLDGLRGGRGRNVVIGTRSGSSGRNLAGRDSENPRVSTSRSNISDPGRTGRDIRVDKADREPTRSSRSTDKGDIRRPSERKSSKEKIDLRRNPPSVTGRYQTDRKDGKRLTPNERKERSPYINKRNDGKKSNGNVRPRSYNPPRKDYRPPKRTNEPGKEYKPPRRTSPPKNYTPPKREKSPQRYSPPKRNNTPRSYSPPRRSYSPPQRSSTPPRSSSGSHSSGRSSGNGRSRR